MYDNVLYHSLFQGRINRKPYSSRDPEVPALKPFDAGRNIRYVPIRNSHFFMQKPSKPARAATQDIDHRIRLMRGRRVILDTDIAALYGVPTFRFNEAVKRNRTRFPDDFMFQLSGQEAASLTSQIAISKRGRGGRRTPPFAFTEYGVVMLSSVLNSERAVQVNILIVRAFVRLREMIVANKDFAARLEKLEANHRLTDSVIEVLIGEIDGVAREVKDMKALPAAPKRKIGFDL